MNPLTRDIIVIGASMGGIQALENLVGALPEDLPAALFVVVHTSPGSPGTLAEILDSAGSLPAQMAAHGQSFHLGRIYVAPPDRHLLLLEGRTVLSRGPRENRTRPAIDPLFRSAAVCCTSRVIGVILSGYLDDGVSGLVAVKRCGGLAMVQDPADTLYGELPRNALRSVEVDHCLPVASIPGMLNRLARESAPQAPEVPDDLKLEVRFAQKAVSDISAEKEIADPSSFSCPDCGGPLWKIRDPKITRFRCNVGHGFTAAALLDEQSEAIERALWAALRSLEDRARMLKNLIDEGRARGSTTHRWDEKMEESLEHAAQLRNLLLNAPNRVSEPAES